MKTKFLLTLAVLLLIPSVTQAEMTVTALESGNVFRSEQSPSVYYLGADGMRYIFPDETTYFTWYDNFDDVVWVSDAEIGRYQIGGNVTYRPGSNLLKIASSPTLYAVSQNGTLHPLASNDIAAELYGLEYRENVKTLPEAFFGNYSRGETIELASQYNKEAELADTQTINQDKSLSAPTVVEVTESGFSEPTISIDSGTAVQWINAMDEKTNANEWDDVWSTGTLQPGEAFIRYFHLQGTWHYYSDYQDRNTHEGAIIVN